MIKIDPDLIRDTNAALDRFQRLIDSIEKAFANNISNEKLSEETRLMLYERVRRDLRIARDNVYDASLSDQQDRYFSLFSNISDIIDLAIDAALNQGSKAGYRQAGSDGGKRSAPQKIAAANIWRKPALDAALTKRAEKPNISTSEIAMLVHGQLRLEVDIETVRTFLYKMEREGRLQKRRYAIKIGLHPLQS